MKSIFRSFFVGLVAVIGACWLAAAASAASPDGMRLYVFSSGWLNIDKSALQTGATDKISVPVAFFLIKHPKGNVLFDTGNNDKVIADPTYWGPLGAMLSDVAKSRSPDLAIDAQLAKIGVKPEDINYVVLGHMHLDHAGNVGKFPNATVVYQRDEIVNAFWPKPGYGCCYITSDFAMLRSKVGENDPAAQKVIELNGDLDLFGDGSIYIHRAVSHTPGTQMMIVRLPKSGVVVLTTDVCYLMENLQKDILPSVSLAYDPAGMLNAYSWIKHMMAAENADVIFAHDPDTFNKHKHSPEYYE
ncbi:MAG TPA: N-acyl homoserine lactonase family protein [Stellaceae bacterium]|jgi:glyoxylase-like metal-dependent hydrolase (beta-lactamase superfamily II)